MHALAMTGLILTVENPKAQRQPFFFSLLIVIIPLLPSSHLSPPPQNEDLSERYRDLERRVEQLSADKSKQGAGASKVGSPGPPIPSTGPAPTTSSTAPAPTSGYRAALDALEEEKQVSLLLSPSSLSSFFSFSVMLSLFPVFASCLHCGRGPPPSLWAWPLISVTPLVRVVINPSHRSPLESCICVFLCHDFWETEFSPFFPSFSLSVTLHCALVGDWLWCCLYIIVHVRVYILPHCLDVTFGVLFFTKCFMLAHPLWPSQPEFVVISCVMYVAIPSQVHKEVSALAHHLSELPFLASESSSLS